MVGEAKVGDSMPFFGISRFAAQASVAENSAGARADHALEKQPADDLFDGRVADGEIARLELGEHTRDRLGQA